MLEFHPLAALEVTEAAEYYEDKAPFLGERFLLALQIALDRIELNPRGLHGHFREYPKEFANPSREDSATL